MEQDAYWNGKVAILPGATHGIGLRLAERLHDLGVRIATVYHMNEQQAKQFQIKFSDCIIIKGNIQEESCIHQLVTAAKHRWGRVDFLINNIGNDCWKTIYDLSIDEWKATEQLLLDAPFITMKECLPIMREQQFGRIINLGASSKNYLKGHAGTAPFGVFKGALVILTQTLALEEISHGITVNVVAPGSTAEAGANPEEKRIPVSRIPLGRRVTRDEVTDAILYFLSENSAGVTGQYIGVNGGCSV